MADFFIENKGYYFVSLCIIFFAILIFVAKFERKNPKAREIVMVAVMVTLAIVSRVIFFMTPQFKPMAAIIIIAGITLGKTSGFLTGALSAFMSNMFFGQGPWTPWQMIAFGIVGFLAGVLFGELAKEREIKRGRLLGLYIYGFMAILVVYGLIMDTGTVLMYTDKPKVSAFVASYATGLIYNIIHGCAVVAFLVLLAEPMIKKINRIRKKFGMFRDN